jgi:hypothetical protein
VRYLLSLALVLLVACIEPAPSGPNEAPAPPSIPTGMGPVTAGPLSALISCVGMPNVGSIAKVSSTPATKSLAQGAVFTVTAAVIRDNASLPGIQLHCQDYSVPVSWGFNYVYLAGWCKGSCSNPQVWEIQSTGGGVGQTFKAILYANGTTKRDTTFITVTP